MAQNKVRIALDSLTGFHYDNLDKNVQELKDIMDILMYLQEYLVRSKVKIPNYKFHIDTLISKSLYHLNTICHLLDGIDLESKRLKYKANILDIPSLYVLLRALLENFLMFDFIYCQPKDDEEVQFRCNIWLLSGYLSRQDIPAEEDISKQKKASDLREINRIRTTVTESKYIKDFKQKHQTKILTKGDERLGKSWPDIMKISGFHPNVAQSLYKLLSSHAHSTGISIFNMSALNTGYSPQNQQAKLITIFSKMIISRFIVLFKDQIKIVELEYNMLDNKIISSIEFYSRLLETGQLNFSRK